MTKVAEDLGISDVALKKICDKHRVPTPPRGYWAKRDAGKPTKQMQFHSTADPQHEHIVIRGSRNNLAPEIREEGLPRRSRKINKINGLMLDRLARVYQCCALKSSRMDRSPFTSEPTTRSPSAPLHWAWLQQSFILRCS